MKSSVHKEIINKASFDDDFDIRTNKIFNLSTYKCDLMISGHADNITHITFLQNGHLASSTYFSQYF